MTDITHLVVNGCSWTYCQGLDDPKTQGWPALLAKDLGVEVVNLAIRGSGNDCIHRRTYEYVYEDLPNGSKPFFVIGWSQYWRKEIWHNDFYETLNYNDYGIIRLPDDAPINNAERALLDNWNEEDFYRKTYLYKLSLMNLFQLHNIPYIMTDFSYQGNHEIIQKIRSRFPTLVDTVLNNPKQIGCMAEVTSSFPKLPCGHDGYDAQVEISRVLKNAIDSHYSNINPVTGNYLTLKDFKFTTYPNWRDDTGAWNLP